MTLEELKVDIEYIKERLDTIVRYQEQQWHEINSTKESLARLKGLLAGLAIFVSGVLTLLKLFI